MTSLPDLDACSAEGTAFEQWERRIGAFAALDPAALSPGAALQSGPLEGCTVGVKDVIDVAGLPTRNGSAACADAPPATRDASVVAGLRAAGARIAGKTVTTEFAYTDPTNCRNPYALDRSPGGSSSGSGAAVGARIVDIALGTQTAGSLCRPAAYCGAVGFKPSHGALPTDGVTPLSPSHDTVGIIARTVPLARRAFAAMGGGQKAPDAPAPRLGSVIVDKSVTPARDTRAAFDEASTLLAEATGAMERLPPLENALAIVEDHRTVMEAECAGCHAGLLDHRLLPLLRPNFRAALLSGAATPPEVSHAAAHRLAVARADYWERHAGIDAILTMPVPDGAPVFGESTGFQHWLTVWTVLGGPLVCVPWGLDLNGLPRAVMLAGRPGGDMGLLDLGEALASLAPVMPPPMLPAL